MAGRHEEGHGVSIEKSIIRHLRTILSDVPDRGRLGYGHFSNFERGLPDDKKEFNMPPKELLTTEEAASLLKVSRQTILKWARQRKIESVHVSRKVVLFTADAMESFLTTKTLRIVSAAAPKSARRDTVTESWEKFNKEVRWWAKKDQE